MPKLTREEIMGLIGQLSTKTHDPERKEVALQKVLLHLRASLAEETIGVSELQRLGKRVSIPSPTHCGDKTCPACNEDLKPLRDQFAAAAITGLLANPKNLEIAVSNVCAEHKIPQFNPTQEQSEFAAKLIAASNAQTAYHYADALLEAREKKEAV